jgi:hypothetical protein
VEKALFMARDSALKATVDAWLAGKAQVTRE